MKMVQALLAVMQRRHFRFDRFLIRYQRIITDGTGVSKIGVFFASIFEVLLILWVRLLFRLLFAEKIEF